ncbi:GNAT family N-acetyltransferase [Actinomadura terrae]|uniref:GNAT family N-acetyltransferase n=1 Tax=Actinomadura terrae TaxID=604353 RepID=UPI001FA817D9|nr:GNAT family N-acetyltransferase [Actinomadura terrae]
MRIDELAGLRIAVVDADEAVRTDWDACRPTGDVPSGEGIDLVRVLDPPPGRWPDLAASGLLPRPDRVTWLAATGADDAGFLAGMSAKERQGITLARRRAAKAGLTLSHEPLTPEALDTFLDLYEESVGEMPNGLAVARNHRDTIVAGIERFFIVGAYRDGVMQGAAIGECCADIGVARLRFSAVTAEHRRISLSRVLYLEAVRVVREAGYAKVTLGNDPNLYGHLVMPGLFAFKARLGFRPVPSTTVNAGDGQDVADRVLSMRALADPSFALTYRDFRDRSGRELRFDFYSVDGQADTGLFTTCMPADVHIHRVEG